MTTQPYQPGALFLALAGGVIIGLALGSAPTAEAESTVGVNLNTFCPTGSTATAIGFVHDDDLQKAMWVYTCANEEGSQGATPR